ncbi:helix-turn-helix domain-containing protein [Phenylobacterium immobile]|uniref:helix-turn-helix domain-containing protein n=1 Tax=Phenylobacterium immobile TaxID=21 RepID=UPI000A7FEC2F|nr:helix-turn-helix transcriptional regulator [Phenylobacterium immobile]
MDRTLVSAHVAKRLSMRRNELRLSLAQVAARCGVSLQQVHRYETGDNAVSVAMLWQLSKCLDTNIVYFFEGLD